eukprot:2532530-Pyramimonas_sp.AAC.1
MNANMCKQITASARSYGRLFTAHSADSEVARNVIKAVTNGIGLLAEGTTEAEAATLLQGTMDVFLFADPDAAAVQEKAKFNLKEPTINRDNFRSMGMK